MRFLSGTMVGMWHGQAQARFQQNVCSLRGDPIAFFEDATWEIRHHRVWFIGFNGIVALWKTSECIDGKNHLYGNSLGPLKSVITIIQTIGFFVQDLSNARPIHDCADGDNRGSRCAKIGDLCEKNQCKGGTGKLKFMGNKSKNRNMKKCLLKNKTPRGRK